MTWNLQLHNVCSDFSEANMSTQSGVLRILNCEEVLYGKPVRSKFGPLHENALYGINSATQNIKNPLNFIPANFFGNVNLTSNMIDPEYMRRGALIVKAVKEGLAIMRMRYRAEAGEGESGRQFLLSRTLILSGIQYWHEIPAGLFAYCEQSLDAHPFIFDQPTLVTSHTIELPAYKQNDVNWYDGLTRHRQNQLGSVFQAIRKRISWTVSEIVAKEENQRPASLIAADLDVIASLPSEFPLRVNDTDKFILSLGLEPHLVPGAISYFPEHTGNTIEAPDLQALRVAIINSKTDDLTGLEEKRPNEHFFDSLDRRIGKDPIPLKSNARKIPY